jgi:hypothetical protein
MWADMAIKDGARVHAAFMVGSKALGNVEDRSAFTNNGGSLFSNWGRLIMMTGARFIVTVS